jgi:soluble lytic murein transglycosylase-like protein
LSVKFSRRTGLASGLTALGLLLFHEPSLAGGQLEEPLVDSVRSALSSAIANSEPPAPEFADTESRLKYLRWLGRMSDRLRKQKPDWHMRKEFLQTVWYESQRAGLDPTLVLGLIQVESNFRKFAVSSVGARGYMQVMPFWAKLIGAADHNLFNLRTNLRYGCVILRHYLDIEQGNVFRALGRYNGSLGKADYPNTVLRAWHGQWRYADGSDRGKP